MIKCRLAIQKIAKLISRSYHENDIIFSKLFSAKDDIEKSELPELLFETNQFMIEIYYKNKRIEQWNIMYPYNKEKISNITFISLTRRIYTCILLTPSYVRFKKGEPLSYKIVYGNNEGFESKQCIYIDINADNFSINCTFLEKLPTESKPMRVTSHQPSISNEFPDSGDKTGKSPSEILYSRSLSTTPSNINAFVPRPKSNSLKLSNQSNKSLNSNNYEEMRIPKYSKDGEIKKIKADEDELSLTPIEGLTDSIMITIKYNKSNLTFVVPITTTIKELKDKVDLRIQKQEIDSNEIDFNGCKLSFRASNGKPIMLEDGTKTLKDYGITEDQELDYTITYDDNKWNIKITIEFSKRNIKELSFIIPNTTIVQDLIDNINLHIRKYDDSNNLNFSGCQLTFNDSNGKLIKLEDGTKTLKDYGVKDQKLFYFIAHYDTSFKSELNELNRLINDSLILKKKNLIDLLNNSN